MALLIGYFVPVLYWIDSRVKKCGSKAYFNTSTKHRMKNIRQRFQKRNKTMFNYNYIKLNKRACPQTMFKILRLWRQRCQMKQGCQIKI